MQKYHITNISAESKYYSFLLAKTEDKEIAEKWDHFILTVDGRLLMNTDEPKTDSNQSSYNIGVDTFACILDDIPTFRFVFAESKWLEKCLKLEEIRLLNSVGVLKYEGLSVADSINFYYYLVDRSNANSNGTVHPLPNPNNKFIKIVPKYILSCDCLVFEISDLGNPAISPSKNLSEDTKKASSFDNSLNLIDFKRIPKISKQLGSSNKIYSFKSQYALLSDIHFLNCLVRGKKSIASYVQNGSNYQFILNHQIRKSLNKLYLRAKL